MRVVMHNTDGVNAYAAEVAAVLTRRGVAVTVVDAANSQHRPPAGVRWRRLLPDNFGSPPAPLQALRLLRGLAATVSCSLRGHVLVVAFARFPLESLAFALLAVLGRPVITVLHNPVPRHQESTLTRWSRRAVLRRAAAVVVHAERLIADIPAIVRPARVAVCPHPPYLHTAPVPDAPPPAPGGRRWVAYVGTLRWDKGADLLPEVLAAVPEERRAELGVVVCGRGHLPEGSWERLAALGYATRDLTSEEPVPQELLLQVLAERPLVLAPYVAATQSGTVILALTMGCRVVAFDGGGIPDVLSPEGLVPSGDVDAMARAVAEDRGGTARVPLDRWEADTGDAWLRLLARVSAEAPGGVR